MDDDVMRLKREVRDARVRIAIEADLLRMEEMRRAKEKGKPMAIAFAGLRLAASDDVILAVWDAFGQEQTQLLRDFETEGIPFPPHGREEIVILSDDSPWYAFSPGSMISMMVARETRRMLSRESFLRQVFPPLPLSVE